MSTKNKESLVETSKKSNFPEKATGCYLYAILCLLPLVFVNFYADIAYVKYYFYIGCSLTLLIVLLGYGMLLVYKNKNTIFSGKNWDFIKPLQNGWKHMTVPEKLMLGYLLIAAISTFQSDYFYESFWGNEGRLTGLFLTLIYGSCFLIIGRFGSLKTRLMDAFLFVGNLVCLFGITDYFQMDILGFKENMWQEQLLMFTSTIGNINIYTVVVAMFAAIAMILFIAEQKTGKKIYYYITLIIALSALITGQSDNAYVSLLALFGLSPLYLFKYRWGIKGYGVSVATLLSVIVCVDFCSKTIPSAINLAGMGGIMGIVASLKILPVITVTFWVVLAAIIWIDRKNKTEEASVWWRRGWIGLIVLVCVAVVYVLYDCNIAGNAEKYGPIQSYVLLNDRWGTNRGYIWRVALECYGDYPWYRKLVGFGPDTFGIITYHKYRPEMQRLFGEIFDSTHNEYIQYLVTVGAAGLLLYLSMIAVSVKRIWQKQKDNPLAMAVMFALICYWMQAFVNINIPISAALMWTLWGLSMAACRKAP